MLGCEVLSVCLGGLTVRVVFPRLGLCEHDMLADKHAGSVCVEFWGVLRTGD